jgi:hypothetical protein
MFQLHLQPFDSSVSRDPWFALIVGIWAVVIAIDRMHGVSVILRIIWRAF